jgi:hypothetical protein
MRWQVYAWGLLVLMLGGVALAGPGDQLCGDEKQIRQILADARETLAELRGLAAAQKDYIARRQLLRRADALRRQLHRLHRALALAEAETAPPEPAVQPMAAEAFDALIASLKAESFAKGKVRLVREAAAHHAFSVAQVKRVMKQFSFADGKVEAAALMHPKLVDPESFFQVYGQLKFESDKRKLRQRIAEQ